MKQNIQSLECQLLLETPSNLSFSVKFKEVIILAIPAIFSQFLSLIPEIINLHLIGIYGSRNEINGIAIGNTFLSMFPNTVMYGINGALDTLLSRAYGAKKFQLCGHYLNTARCILIVLWLSFSPLFYFSDRLFIFLGQDPLSSHYTQVYLTYLIPGSLFFFFADCQRRLINSFKLVRVQTIIMAISVSFHYLLAFYMISELKMGVKGVSIAATCTFFLNMTLSFAANYLYPVLRQTYTPFNTKELLFKKLASIGVFNMLMNGLKWYVFYYISLLAGAILGVVEQTSFALVFQYVYFVIQVATGFSTSFCQLIGSSMGAKRFQDAKAYGVFVYQLGIPLAVVFCLTTSTFGKEIAQFFTNDSLLVANMMLCFSVVSVSLFFDFIQQMQLGIVRGLGLYKEASKANFLAYECVMMPLVSVWAVYVWRDVRVLWSSLMVAHIIVNVLYFYIVWGFKGESKSFDKELLLSSANTKEDIESEKKSGSSKDEEEIQLIEKDKEIKQ